jgi:CRISPR-associated endonuclease/helicase Cas3
MREAYAEFFRRVTGNKILPYQHRYGQNPFSPTLLVVPTGLGKTDAVLVPWLFAQLCGEDLAPTRLIIVLPRQNLTVQTAKNARARVRAAGLDSRVKVLELMAGSEDNKENDLRPNEPAIIVSTQDLYISRALNRGYARKAPRWPIDFALYNQDCLVVYDEIQLMADALATSAQLAAFRKQYGTYGVAPSVWMSATVNPNWLKTVDFTEPPREVRLEEEDLSEPIVRARRGASKKLARAPEECRDAAGCAAFVLANHRPGTRTLVIVNTVSRAREIFKAVRQGFSGAILLHSRFRPEDKEQTAGRLDADIPEKGQIVVSTQVLEAGVDITARLLVTDIAPWGSLVQRFGRVNRKGDDSDAEIWWIDRPTPHAKQKNPTAPYESAEIERAVERVKLLTSAALRDLHLVPEDGPAPWKYVLRRSDLLDLFDTSPDISGNPMDVSRFIRASEDKDIYLAWRDWEGEAEPPPSFPDVADGELCPVPIGELREFMKKHVVYVWNFATERWSEADKDTLYAGMVGVTRSTEGGYTSAEGWSPESKARVQVLAAMKTKSEGDSTNPGTFQSYRQTLSAHTWRVMQELETLLSSHTLDEPHAAALRLAAARHDWGKAHEVFQRTLHKHDDSTELLAKQVWGSGGHERQHFRHELASALAMLASGDPDLAVYVVAAHHGRIRMGIRSMPGETEREQKRRARGIEDGDSLPACELAPGITVPAVELSLSTMELGADGGSWTDRMLRLRDAIGPFRLAYLEMLLRTADERASAFPELEAATCIK